MVTHGAAAGSAEAAEGNNRFFAAARVAQANCSLTGSRSLFLGEVGFCFGEFGALGAVGTTRCSEPSLPCALELPWA